MTVRVRRMNMRRFAAVVLLVVTTFMGVALLALWKSIAAQSSGSFSRGTGTAEPTSSESASTHKLPGLEQPVTVIRDTWGIPHIYAQNQHDMFFAQGYATAQDRLFQMELWKRAGQGTLAEILGATFPAARHRGQTSAIPRRHGRGICQLCSGRETNSGSFHRRVSTPISKRFQHPGGPGLTPDFKAAGFAPEPWKPEDCPDTNGWLSR